ncbi:N-acetyltransferase family protein [Halomicrococcus sp. SG-WS-1]|uniref:GNAT family N-acetyltransferase n=1 Tax=Halomicrococcus sp. SG-WS-1 TaxID=3439057 RepID=UPI003F7A9CEB
MTGATVELREATHDDFEAVAEFTRDTWPERDGGDYIPDVYHDWIEGDDKRTVVADVVERDSTGGRGSSDEVGDAIAGIAQGVLLSDWEAWGQGMRVNPAFRGEGVGMRMTRDLFDWARERGATVLRNMVFSWNVAGLGQSRAAGYDPVTEFRWATPDPDPDADPALDVTADPRAAWRYWTDSAAREHLAGLALDAEESWAVSELTREDLRRAADEDGLFVVQADGTRGLAYRVREYDREGDDGGEERWVEYGVGAWADVDAARSLFAAVARDAAERGATRTRMLVPETPQYVSDAAYCRTGVADEPDFVLAADLTADHRRR